MKFTLSLEIQRTRHGPGTPKYNFRACLLMFRRNSGLRVKNTHLPAVVVKQVVESILFFIITYYVVHSFFSCPYLKFIDVHKIGTIFITCLFMEPAKHLTCFHQLQVVFYTSSTCKKNILKKSKPRVHS